MTRSRTAAPGDPRWRRLLRVGGGLLLLGLATALLLGQQYVRYGEMSLAGLWFDTFLTGTTHTSRDVIYFSWTEGSLIGMRGTWECTVALLAAPLCAIGALLLAATRLPWQRLLMGLGVALGLLVVVNQIRLAMIALSLQRWGIPGYDLSHKVVGSIFAIIGFALAAVVFVKIAAASQRRRRHRSVPSLG